MSSGWSMFVVLVTLLSLAMVVWLLVANRSKEGKGEELDHEFDGIKAIRPEVVDETGRVADFCLVDTQMLDDDFFDTLGDVVAHTSNLRFVGL